MKKVYKLKNLECANCAAKMEDLISKIDGVNKCNINFLMEKMVIDLDENNLDEIIKKASGCIKKIEQECEIIL